MTSSVRRLAPAPKIKEELSNHVIELIQHELKASDWTLVELPILRVDRRIQSKGNQYHSIFKWLKNHSA